MVYHTGDHSRFSHSLGVYEITRRMMEEVPDLAGALSQEQKVIGMLAALLHDIGHGPYSHLFESITGISHESMSARIILEEGSEVHAILAAADPGLPEQVADVLAHEGENHLLSSMISSQLDADRMDYLLRDAYCTGVQYGCFDLERILRTLRVKDGQLCIKQSGVRSVEDYIMARSQMYWQVYLHPDAFGFERLILSFFVRYAKVRQEQPIAVFEFLWRPMGLEDFFCTDEAAMQYGFSQAMHHPDPILSDLAGRIINRRLFAWIEDPSDQQIERVLAILEERQMDADAGFYLQKPVLNQVLPYAEEDSEPIMVLCLDGSLKKLSQVSEIARVLLKMQDEAPSRLYTALRPEDFALPSENQMNVQAE